MNMARTKKNMVNYKTPIAFFAYKRPLHAFQSLESLSKNDGAEKSELFIFCDGPKTSGDEENVLKTRDVVKSKKWCGKVNIIERDENLGLANSIISGVTQLCEEYGRVIVIEDDLILSNNFLNYMNSALINYQYANSVMHIAAYLWPLNIKIEKPFLLRNASCWGWGTWQRAWCNFNDNASELLRIIKSNFYEKQFTFNYSRPQYLNMLSRVAENKLDSWAIRWYASLFLLNGVSLYPPYSLVHNIGHDGSGTNCCKTSIFDTAAPMQRVSLTDYPERILENKQMRGSVTKFFHGINGNQKGLWHRFRKLFNFFTVGF